MTNNSSSVTTQSISPLRQRFIDDMSLRKLQPRTQEAYLRAIKRLTRFLKRSPDTATAEDLRQFQLHMVNEGASAITINATITALRFFFQITLRRPDVVSMLSHIHEPRKLPVILSVEEVARLLNIANDKYRAALAVAYGAGLRASEIVNLKVSDIDSQRMLIHVEQGKGRKDRYAKLSPALLQCLRTWWRAANAKGKMLKNGWLFPSRNPIHHISTRQLHRACKAVASVADIDKNVSLHTFRHSFATHLLENHVDIRVIQVLLGHQRLETTAQYSQVATHLLSEVESPLDRLDSLPVKKKNKKQ